MKKVLLIAALGMISFPALAQKAKVDKKEVAAKPYTKTQRKAIIKQMRKDGKLKHVEVQAAPVAVVAPAADMQVDLINIPPAQFQNVVLDLLKTPAGIVTAIEQISTLPPVQMESVAKILINLSDTEIQLAVVKIPSATIEELINNVISLPENTQIIVLKVLSLAPVETLAAVLVKTDPGIAAVLVKEIPQPRLMQLTNAFTGSLAKGYIANGNMAKLASLLKKAGVNQTIVQAFIQRLTQ